MARRAAVVLYRRAVSTDWQIRPATDADLGPIIDLARQALGWDDDPRNEALFRWKHLDNPFGRSPMWVADAGDRLVGFRAMMRWGFVTPTGDKLSAVRAVDTATHPDAQRQGIFRALTSHAVEALTDEGVDFVFNTPNDKSRPGYLDLGWQVVGRVGVSVQIRSLAALRPLAGARAAAQRWGIPTDAGHDVGEIDGQLTGGREPQPRPGLRTDTGLEYRRWRFGLEPLAYRAEPVPGGGWLVFRLRSRGAATELAVVSTPEGCGSTVRRLLSATGADYALAVGRPMRRSAVPVPRLGPVLVSRALAGSAPTSLDGWALELADVELF